MKKREDPRKNIRNMIAENDLEHLLMKAGEIHGHYCSYVAYGVRAVCTAFRKLGIAESTGMEKIMAVVECNNCFADGIQAISGCTFGNNAMIYKDLGKTAVTFYRREDDSGVRVMVNPPDEHSDEDPVYKEAMELFDRGVKKREKLTPEEYSRMNELWTQMSFGVLEKDEKDIFIVQDVVPEGLEYAPIFDSATCSKCGEQAMETRTRLHEGSPVCIRCIGEDYWMVAGRGIHPVKGKSAV